MAEAVLRIRMDREWMALVSYRVALEEIVRRHQEESWAFSREDAAGLADKVLQMFPEEDGGEP